MGIFHCYVSLPEGIYTLAPYTKMSCRKNSLLQIQEVVAPDPLVQAVAVEAPLEAPEAPWDGTVVVKPTNHFGRDETYEQQICFSLRIRLYVLRKGFIPTSLFFSDGIGTRKILF